MTWWLRTKPSNQKLTTSETGRLSDSYEETWTNKNGEPLSFSLRTTTSVVKKTSSNLRKMSSLFRCLRNLRRQTAREDSYNQILSGLSQEEILPGRTCRSYNWNANERLLSVTKLLRTKTPRIPLWSTKSRWLSSYRDSYPKQRKKSDHEIIRLRWTLSLGQTLKKLTSKVLRMIVSAIRGRLTVLRKD